MKFIQSLISVFNPRRSRNCRKRSERQHSEHQYGKINNKSSDEFYRRELNRKYEEALIKEGFM